MADRDLPATRPDDLTSGTVYIRRSSDGWYMQMVDYGRGVRPLWVPKRELATTIASRADAYRLAQSLHTPITIEAAGDD